MGSIDQLRARIGLGQPLSTEDPQIEPLTPADARGLRLPWLSRFSPDTLAMHLHAHEEMALWVPQTGEYIVAEPWRRRGEIANIVEVTARKGKVALVRSLLERLAGMGLRLVLLSDDAWRDQTRLYADLGFGQVEMIVFFEKSLKRETIVPTPPGSSAAASLPALRFARAEPADLDVLLRLDHGSFPWLWWNSLEELRSYMQISNVYIFIAYLQDEPIGYASFTLYPAWAHLDRLAVVEAHQGRRLGAAQLAYVLGLMLQMGAGSVALSTQSNNTQSHRLYTGFGFRQTSEKMRFYGIVLDPELRLG